MQAKKSSFGDDKFESAIMVLWLVLHESQLKLIYRDRKHLLKNIFFKICA